MRKNKSMLTKTVLYGLGVSLFIGSLVVPLGINILSQNVVNNTLVRENASDNKGIKIAKNSSVDADLKEKPFALSPTVANKDLVKLFNISGSGELSVKDKPNLENYLKSYDGKLDLNELGNEVEIIGDGCFRGIRNLQTITIPDSVTTIGKFVFDSCEQLNKVEFSDQSRLESIGDGAFNFCSSLTSIIIPKQVKQIGKFIFTHCQKLNSSNVFNNSPVLFDWWVRNHQYENDQTMAQIIEETGTIDLSQFTNSAEEKFSVIGFCAFRGCEKLTNITIPNSVTTIGDYAFSTNNKLTYVTIPSSVTEIGIEIFGDGPNLSSDKVFNNSSVLFGWWVNEHKYKEFGSQTMAKIIEQTGAIDLSQFKNSAGKDFNVIGGNAFKNCSNLTSFCVPNSVTSIGELAFYGCTSLEKVIFGQQCELKGIGLFAFKNCTKLTNIIIPELVNCIGEGAFVSCKSLEKIKIPNSVNRIGNLTFSKCTNLKEVYISESVKTIGANAFSGCTSLVNITLPNSVTTIGENVFSNAGLTTITIPKNVKIITAGAFEGCAQLQGVFFDEHSELEKIDDNAFAWCSDLINISIPNSVVSIGDNAFTGCISLTSIVIPKSLMNIGVEAFYNCYSLKSVTFFGNEESVLELGKEAFPLTVKYFYFKNKVFLKRFIFKFQVNFFLVEFVLLDDFFKFGNSESILVGLEPPSTRREELVIPGFVKIIGDGKNAVFTNRTQNKIIIVPASVGEIKSNAFNSCISLTTVVISSISINIDSNAFVNMPNTDYYIPANVNIEGQLKRNGISERQIHFFERKPINPQLQSFCFVRSRWGSYILGFMIGLVLMTPVAIKINKVLKKSFKQSD